jgi:hypothetical protein
MKIRQNKELATNAKLMFKKNDVDNTRLPIVVSILIN